MTPEKQEKADREFITLRRAVLLRDTCGYL